MRTFFACLLFGLSAGQVYASGGASCGSTEGPANVAIQAGITHGMGGPVFSLIGGVTINDDKTAPDLRASTFDKEQLAQYWLDGEELRFLLYRERQGDGAFGSVELEVRAKDTGDDATYDGTYKISVFDTTQANDAPPVVYEGKVTCFVE